ncbi:hypothetical protein A0J47_011730 [Photobacterium damselae subsp. damselae]|uniref:beta/gamma crystallin-related protein n=1 Tax=Photobacterium damselae TaxID=38293 RepID=UPI00083A1481|nr:beta/gamma crystallin-related protein [Photobacterium damselae]QSH56585.1 hypothetical protein A0J47_011730 [Photobacterium damselae subsp. damselae]
MKRIFSWLSAAAFLFSSSSFAAINFNQNIIVSGSNNGSVNRPVSVCVLNPFTKIFAEAGITEAQARHNVSLACQRDQGSNSIFCEESKARCHQSQIWNGDQTSGNSGELIIYNMRNQAGRTVTITDNIADLSNVQFDNTLESFEIPVGWTVRFYEDKNFSGGYYTRTAGKYNADGFMNKISSIQIMQR